MRMFFYRIASIALAAALVAGVAAADTVILKDNSRIKGLILDEFKDRVVVSTAAGEKTFMKSDIRYAVYDDEERTLLQVGRNQFKKGNYIDAYYTYQKAVELNPDLDEALERRNFLRSYLETKMRYDIADGIQAKRERYAGAEGETILQKVKDELGMALSNDGKYVVIEKIVKNVSGASRPLFREGDRIVSVWGEMAAYMDAEEVAEMLLRPGEVRFVIERAVRPRLSLPRSFIPVLPLTTYRNIIGGELKLTRKGVILDRVFADGPLGRAGAKQGDLLYRICGKNTRYMPMKDIIKMLDESRGKEIETVIQRSVTVWKKE